MTTICIQEQKLIFNQDEIELYEKILNALNVKYSKRERYETDYTISDLMEECSPRTRNGLRIFVSKQDYDKDCLYFVSNYTTTKFAKCRNVGEKSVNEVVNILKSHGFVWEHKSLPKSYKKYLHR